jgi:hypothetical protein
LANVGKGKVLANTEAPIRMGVMWSTDIGSGRP